MGIKVSKLERKQVKPRSTWYCHKCGRENVKRKGKARQRCRCGQLVWLGRRPA